MKKKIDRRSWAFIIPSVILIVAFVFYPMVQAFITSMQTGMGNNLRFAGAANYKRHLTDSTFVKALCNTVMYLVIQVPVMIILALVISSMLNDKKLKGRGNCFYVGRVFVWQYSCSIYLNYLIGEKKCVKKSEG